MVTNLINNTFKEWTKVGLRPVVADTLLRAYPNAVRPTNVQKKLLQALSYGYSVAVRGLPATGKSFAIAAWLLGLERAMREIKGRPDRVPTTSALVIVPNVDLAVQYYCTLLNMISHSDSEALRSTPDAFVQLLHRKSNEAELDQLIKLQRYPHPHIIIAPPTIILDILADKDESVRNLIDISNLKAIVLEEIDAAISKLQYFSKMKKKAKFTQQWENKQVPLQILLDYIIKRRTADARRAGVEPEQPQLVFPTATLSSAQIKRFLLVWHLDWISSEERDGSGPRLFNHIQPGDEWKRRARSNSLVAIEDPPLSHDEIVQFVPDNLHHHVVSYNIRNGTLRDAPMPKLNTTHRETLAAQIEVLETAYCGAERQFETWNESAEPNKYVGYPDHIAIDVLLQLLKHDNYPRNVIVALGSEVSMVGFREKAAEAGITCKSLLAKKWNDDRVVGTLPLGRTDMLLDRNTRLKINAEAEGGDKSKTTVWISNFFFCRGLDTPGIRHFYILHRMERAREYITYAGRVARWPFATKADEMRDPRNRGSDRRSTGKVVSVLLERPPGMGGMLYDDDIPMQKIVLVADGGAAEERAWAEEAVRLAKIGCSAEPYFAVREAADVGSEAAVVEGEAADVGGEAADVGGEAADVGGEAADAEGGAADAEGGAADMGGGAAGMEGGVAGMGSGAADVGSKAAGVEGEAVGVEGEAVDVEGEEVVQAQEGEKEELSAEPEARTEIPEESAEAEMQVKAQEEKGNEERRLAELPAFLLEALGLLDGTAKPKNEANNPQEPGEGEKKSE